MSISSDVVISIIKKWKGTSKEIDKIIKHGSRTLLKQGDRKTLNHFGLNNSNSIELTDFKILTPKIKIGKDLQFTFSLKNNQSKKQVIRIEYGLYYKKANGQLSKKVFKISERKFETFETTQHKRRHSFRIITTRKFYTGIHQLAMILNGKEHEPLQFNLTQYE